MKLTPFQRALLAVLDETGGFTTGRASERADHPYCRDNARQRSAAARYDFAEMMTEGLVRPIDDLKPIVWVRTKAGTAALVGQKP